MTEDYYKLTEREKLIHGSGIGWTMEEAKRFYASCDINCPWRLAFLYSGDVDTWMKWGDLFQKAKYKRCSFMDPHVKLPDPWDDDNAAPTIHEPEYYI